MLTTFDVIIIGAGPAGASCAILLARAGWRVALVEKSALPRGKLCGERLGAATLPLLTGLGVGAALADLCGPSLRRLALIHREREIRAALPRSPDPRHPWGRALRREHLDAVLLKRAAQGGANVFQPWQAHRVRGAPGDIGCDLSHVNWTDQLTLQGALVIDAQGAPDTLPDSDAGSAGAQSDGDLFTFKGSFANLDLDAGMLQVSSFAGGHASLLMADRDTVTLTLCLRRDQLALCREQFPDHPAADAAVAYLNTACPATGDLLATGKQRGAWLGDGPLRPGMRMHVVSGRVFAVGDAAGAAHPMLGDGVDMAIESALLLARMLIAAGRGELRQRSLRLLHGAYLNAWRARFAARVQHAGWAAQLAAHPALMRPLVALTAQFPALFSAAARLAARRAEPDPGALAAP